jgi:hypothetical protein
MNIVNKEIIDAVYQDLKNRTINPAGAFDKGGRFWLENDELVNVRCPSAAWPYSQMTAARTRKYVTKVCEKFSCTSEKNLRSHV